MTSLLGDYIIGYMGTNIPQQAEDSSTTYTTFFRLGSFGNPLRLVRPTLIRLNVSRFVNSSLRPTMLVLLQLSRFNSAIWKHTYIQNLKSTFTISHKTNMPAAQLILWIWHRLDKHRIGVQSIITATASSTRKKLELYLHMQDKAHCKV